MKLRDLPENQVGFYYQTFEGEVDEVDEDGYLTGEKTISYNNPVFAKARISPNTTDVDDTPFGRDCVYDKMISTVQDLPIVESTRLFIDVVPELNGDGSTDTPPDYVVVRVAKDLHQKLWAIRKVEGYDYVQGKPSE